MSSTVVFHLVWTPLGGGPVERFLAGYDARPAGESHRLVIIVNGPAEPWLEPLLAARDADVLPTPQPMLDLAAYRYALPLARDAGVCCFLNSYSRPAADGWLRKLTMPLQDDRVGISGAGGSCESMRDHFAWVPASTDLCHLAGVRRLRAQTASFRERVRANRLFPPAPNPHVRTNAFAMRVGVAARLRWPAPRTKRQAWAIESGRDGLSSQVRREGRELVVVGADGRSFGVDAWPASGTFRSGGQENLLVHDNRTDDYADADADERERLRRLAWPAHHA